MRVFIIALLICSYHTGWSQADSTGRSMRRVSVDFAATFSKFQQQVKSDIGTVSGQRLVDENQFGYHLSVDYLLTKWVSLGWYVRHDIGTREAALFAGFDSSGATVTSNALGGKYTETWTGPKVSFYWKNLTTDLGFGAIGIRTDQGRYDLPNNQGDLGGDFTTHPTIAWMLGIGGMVPITERFSMSFKAEYRVRYYTERGGVALVGEVEHGTQSLVPMIGVKYKL